MFEEDLTVFFDDFALPVTWQGVFVERGGILDEPQEYVGEDGEVMLTDYKLMVRAAEFGRIRMGAIVDVADVRYRARADARLTGDGAIATVPLMRLRGIQYGGVRLIDAGDVVQTETVVEEGGVRE